MSPPYGPSGEQFEISFGDQRAVVVEVGGGLRSYTVGGADCLDGYDLDAMCPSGRGQVLAPWPNRLEDGRYDFDGRTYQVALSDPAAHNAIHGLVRWSAWRAVEHEPHRIVLEHRLHPRPGYPFAVRIAVAYSLSEEGLAVHARAENVGRDACPFGFGMHPYLTLGTRVDGLTLEAPAATVLHSDERGIPRSSAKVDGTDHDFRRSRGIGATVLDHCFTDFERDDDGRARVELRNPGDGSGVAVWFDERFPFAMLFTGDPLSDVDRRALAIEPMTCPPNALRSGEAVLRLEPGDRFGGAWGIAPLGR